MAVGRIRITTATLNMGSGRKPLSHFRLPENWYRYPMAGLRFLTCRSNTVNENVSSITSSLRDAIKEGDVKKVRRVLQEPDVNLEELEQTGMTPLGLAADLGHLEIVKLLIKVRVYADVAWWSFCWECYIGIPSQRTHEGRMSLLRQTTSLRRFDVMITLLLRHVSAGIILLTNCESMNIYVCKHGIIWNRARITKFAPNMYLEILSAGVENEGHWHWLSRSFGHFKFHKTAFNVALVYWSRPAKGRYPSQTCSWFLLFCFIFPFAAWSIREQARFLRTHRSTIRGRIQPHRHNALSHWKGCVSK